MAQLIPLPVAGGGVSEPDLIEIGSVPADGTVMTNVDHTAISAQTNGQTNRAFTTVKWADNSFGLFWIANTSPYEVFYSHLTTNADGSKAADSPKIDLSSHWQGGTGLNSNNKGLIEVKKLDADTVAALITGDIGGTTYYWNVNVYDKSSDTVTQQGSVQSQALAFNGYQGAYHMALAIHDADTVMAFMSDANSTTIPKVYPIKVTPTKSIGTVVTCGTIGANEAKAMAFTDDNGLVYLVNGTAADNAARLQTFTVTPGATPSAVHTQTIATFTKSLEGYLSAEVQSDAGFDNGGVASSLINRNDIDSGRFIGINNNTSGTTSQGTIAGFTGETDKKQFIRHISPAENSGVYYGSSARGGRLLEISYDAVTFWGRYLAITYISGGDIHINAFNFNWSTFAVKADTIANQGKATTAITMPAAGLLGVIYGNSAATNIVIIYDEDGSGDINTVDVPITL